MFSQCRLINSWYVIQNTSRIHGFLINFAFSSRHRDRACSQTATALRVIASVILSRAIYRSFSPRLGLVPEKLNQPARIFLARERLSSPERQVAARARREGESRARVRLLVTPLKRVSLCLITHSGLRQAERQPWLRPSSPSRLVSSTDFPAKIDRPTTVSLFDSPSLLAERFLGLGLGGVCSIEGCVFNAGLIGKQKLESFIHRFLRRRQS